MSKIHPLFEYESLNEANLYSLSEMTIELWPECNFNEEKLNWKQLISDNNHYVALAKINDSYVGFIHISIRHEYVEGADLEHTAYLEGIYIKSDFRKKGIARQLLANAEKWAKSRGLKQLASDTEITNLISQSFHEKTGFSEINRIVCFIKNI